MRAPLAAISSPRQKVAEPVQSSDMRERTTSAGIFSVIIIAFFCQLLAADQFVQPLISVERNLNVQTWQITSNEITPVSRATASPVMTRLIVMRNPASPSAARFCALAWPKG